MNVESISNLTVRLYKVRQLSWRPAQVNRALITSQALEEIRPGQYNQNTSMASRYRAKVKRFGGMLPLFLFILH